MKQEIPKQPNGNGKCEETKDRQTYISQKKIRRNRQTVIFVLIKNSQQVPGNLQIK
jgi:hypothetical protein